jgi:adenine-specific DNA-methyltransferase
MIFITPRSFCSGHYFQRFRKHFFQTVALRRAHLFESRKKIFGEDDVLQETVIFSALKESPLNGFVEISSSQGIDDVDAAVPRPLLLSDVIDTDTEESIVHFPVDDFDNDVREIFSQWDCRLNSFGLQISTGPIVPFRTSALVDNGESESAPVLWIQHINRMAVTWPLLEFSKRQKIRVALDTYNLLLPNSNFVFLRRFSPKEENSRIVAAPYLKGNILSEFLGVENHVNYIHRPNGTLSDAEALGLAAFLNSLWVEQYFRISNSNTQVNAAEIRNLPLPPLEKIINIGKRLRSHEEINHIALINQIVGEELELPLKVSKANGGHMTKIEEAKDLLNALGLPPAQRNELAALTLLALGNISESDAWSQAQRRSIRIHDMILFVEQNYRKRYAENTRETFRRQVLHQFEQARIIDRNPDDPTLPTNSPRTHYALSESVLAAVQNYGTKTGQKLLEKFRAAQGTLLEAVS